MLSRVHFQHALTLPSSDIHNIGLFRRAMRSTCLTSLATVGVAFAAPRLHPHQVLERRALSTQTVTHTSTATSDVAAAAATALTESSTSYVKGKAFDRILVIYLETTAFDNAIQDREFHISLPLSIKAHKLTLYEANCQALIKQGILHTETYGVGVPSQPNYIAPASGDTFGLNSDSFILVNKNVSTVVDLLEDKCISWSDYNEGLPYTGFEGVSLPNAR